MIYYVNAIFSIVSLTILWTLVWLYKSYTVDAFRQKVFALRDEMFDAAADGKIPFNHKGYGRLRSTMNGAIRYAEEYSILHMTIWYLFQRNNNLPMKRYQDAFLDEIRDLPEEEQSILKGYRKRFQSLLIRQIITNSPILIVPLLIPIMVYSALVSVSSWFRKTVLSLVTNGLAGHIDDMQSFAYEIGRDT